MKLSILILTHKRPFLFNRCMESAMFQLEDKDVEVIVNNDSRDILEWNHPQIKYYYEQGENLSDIYKFLLSKATGEYVYFLEDDDFLVADFVHKLPFKGDVIAGNYMPTWNEKHAVRCSTMYGDKTYKSPATFLKATNLEDLQLSQYVFKRSCIVDFPFPADNNIHNDINLLMYAVQNSKNIKTMSKVFFYQTTDGGDNISFPESKPSIEVTKSMDFVKNYAFASELQSTTET